MNEKAKKLSPVRVCEDIWLYYFNQYLFGKGLITEQEYNRMTAMIASGKRPKW
ncbi:MAG: hypothetical protein IJW40_11185 [Clostridia bacterium]|nr:hypothetical protein [Clostridia bacterium]